MNFDLYICNLYVTHRYLRVTCKLKIMETSLIEKLNKSRYNLIKWFTIGWAMWFGGFMLKDLISNNLILVLIILVGLFGWILFAVSLIKFRKLGKIVNSDGDLKNALNDELMLYNRNKSFTVGFWALIILICIFYVLAEFITISAFIVCEITLYIGILSALISSLIYNRD